MSHAQLCVNSFGAFGECSLPAASQASTGRSMPALLTPFDRRAAHGFTPSRRANPAPGMKKIGAMQHQCAEGNRRGRYRRLRRVRGRDRIKSTTESRRAGTPLKLFRPLCHHRTGPDAAPRVNGQRLRAGNAAPGRQAATPAGAVHDRRGTAHRAGECPSVRGALLVNPLRFARASACALLSTWPRASPSGWVRPPVSMLTSALVFTRSG